MKSNADILKEIKERRKTSLRDLSSQYERISKCQAFYAGDYMNYKDYVQFATPDGAKKKAMVQINKIKPYVNAVKGFFAQNRRKPKYSAQMDMTDEKQAMMQRMFSKYANALSEHCRANARADQIETQQDGDMLKCGLGVVETELSYGDGYASRSANGEIVMSCVDLHSFWWDPSARETNLIDSRWMGVTKEYDKEDALMLFKGSKEEDFEIETSRSESGYSYDPALGAYDRLRYDWASEKNNTIHVHFYRWYDIEKYYRADNPMKALTQPESVVAAQIELEAIKSEIEDELFDPRAEIISFNEDTKEALEKAFGEYIQPEEFRKKCYYVAIASGNTLFKKIKSIHQDGFGLKVKTGDYDDKNKLWTGLIDSMMEPQTYYNKALTELMFVIAANSKGGVIVEESAIQDIDEFSANYARTDAVCVVNDGAISGGKIRDKRSPFSPTGYEQVIMIADSAIAETAQIDKTFLGSSENKMETAALQRQRIKQIVSSMACYVDSITLYQHEHARLMLDLMRVYAENNQGALFRVLGEDGIEDFVKISRDHLESEYAIVIEEAPVTPEEKSELSSKLMIMGDKLLAGGDTGTAKVFYGLAVKYLNLAPEDEQMAREVLLQQGQVDPAYVAQLEGMVNELRSAMTQEQLKALASQSALNMAKVKETQAKVQQSAAQTTKILEEAKKTSEEVQILDKNSNKAQVTV